MSRARIQLAWVLVLLTGLCTALHAQEDASGFFKVDDRFIVETKWKYTYTLHVESNTIIHKAESFYEFFLYFRYNYTYEQFLNGKLTKGAWSLNGDQLFYSFRNINKFVISDVNKELLVLEFTQPNSKGTYQYHFVRVGSADAPFVRPPYELPEVNVEAPDPKRKDEPGWIAFGKKKKRKKEEEAAKADQEYISIELIGGGYYGGIDPVQRDYIQIKTDGRLIKEFKSQHQDLVVTKKNIPREELERFIQFVMDQKFFELQPVYDCNSAQCLRRKGIKPTPIPLRLAVSYGSRRKVITISIWGKDERNTKYVEYPDSLDNIIDAIQRMASRTEQS